MRADFFSANKSALSLSFTHVEQHKDTDWKRREKVNSESRLKINVVAHTAKNQSAVYKLSAEARRFLRQGLGIPPAHWSDTRTNWQYI